MDIAKRIRRHQPDWWAVPGETYSCSASCTYFFELRGRYWWMSDDPGIPEGWAVIGDWAALADLFGDCAATLERKYTPRPERPRARWYRLRRLCYCDDYAEHLHYRGRRFFS